MASYDWVCPVCESGNVAASDNCLSCDAPVGLTGEQIQLRKRIADDGEAIPAERPDIVLVAASLVVALPIIGLVAKLIAGGFYQAPLLPVVDLIIGVWLGWGFLDRRRWATALFTFLAVLNLIGSALLLSSILNIHNVGDLVILAIIWQRKVQAWFIYK